MMNLEGIHNQDSHPQGASEFKTGNFEEIEALLERIPFLYAKRLEQVTLSENTYQCMALKSLQKELLDLQEQSEASLRRAISHSRIPQLENDVQKVNNEFGKLIEEISAAESTISSLALSTDSWESEKMRMNDEAENLRNAIANVKATSSIEILKPERRRLQVQKREPLQNNELMAKIIKLQGEIRLRQRQLNSSRANPELSERIRTQHVCRGVIETSANLSAATKSKLLSFILM